MDVLHSVLAGSGKESAEAAHLLVHQDEDVFPPLLQEGAVELPPTAASSAFGTQELLKFLDHSGHPLSNWLARKMGATIKPS